MVKSIFSTLLVSSVNMFRPNDFLVIVWMKQVGEKKKKEYLLCGKGLMGSLWMLHAEKNSFAIIQNSLVS